MTSYSTHSPGLVLYVRLLTILLMADEEGETWSTLSIARLRKYTNRRVVVYFNNRGKKEGWVHAIDPVTRTIVLEEENDKSPGAPSKKLTFIMAHAISHVVLVDQDGYSDEVHHEITDFIGSGKSNEYSEDELAKMRGEMIEWFALNRVVPVTQCSDNPAVLSVMGVLFLEPPYDHECCRSSNEIILDRVQKLIRAKQSHNSEFGI